MLIARRTAGALSLAAMLAALVVFSEPRATAQYGVCRVPGPNDSCSPACDFRESVCICPAEGEEPRCVAPADIVNVIMEGARRAEERRRAGRDSPWSGGSPPAAPPSRERRAPVDTRERFRQQTLGLRPFAPAINQCLTRGPDRRGGALGTGTLSVDLTNNCSFVLTCTVRFPGSPSSGQPTPFWLARRERSAGGVAGATTGTEAQYDGPAPTGSPTVQCRPACDQSRGLVDDGLGTCRCDRGLEQYGYDDEGPQCAEPCPPGYRRVIGQPVCEPSGPPPG